MSKISLIRHGQASFGQKNYDQLSEVGMKQSQWLGEHFNSAGIKPGRIITGSLKRHKQTAAGICQGLNFTGNIEEHLGWNEFDFQKIVYAFLALYPELTPKTSQPKAYFSLLKKAMLSWSKNELNASLPETWSDFQLRVSQAMQYSKTEHSASPTLVVSSGGAIAMALKEILRLDNIAMIDLNLQTKNTSISEVNINHSHDQLCSFNTIPHLETDGRNASITYA